MQTDGINTMNIFSRTRFIFTQNVSLSGFMSGIGLAYAYEEKRYWHVPIILLSPGFYAGIQLYVHREKIKNLWSEV